MLDLLANKKLNKTIKWSIAILAVFIIVMIGAVSANAYINDVYKNKFLKNTSIGGIDIGGLSEEQARKVLSDRVDVVSRRGFVYTGQDKTINIFPTLQSIESPDTSYPLIVWDIEKSLAEIEQDQDGHSIKDLWKKIKTLSQGKNYKLYYAWDESQHKDILMDSFANILAMKQEANFEFVGEELKITNEVIGQTFDYAEAMSKTKQQIATLNSEDIKLQTIEDKPLFTANMVENMKDDILAMAEKGDLELSNDNYLWTVKNNIWREWLRLKFKQGEHYVGFDQQEIADYFDSAGISEKLNVPVKNARFSVSDGKVSEFVSSRPGKSINLEDTVNKLEQAVLSEGELKVALPVKEVLPDISNEEVNDLGIVELIGTGTSNFAGSPPNRVHNIGVGADTLHGLLIAPGEEFSLIKALGEIDGEHGYKQELVIKGDKTIPEYGGGLCQIGTTVFRAALGTGLPIVERRNHSYRVSYYEPAGTDATIYSPWPDFKFKNDTEHHILIQTRIEGNDIYFDFWGTSDGRYATRTDPIIYNIVSPPPTKIIKTTELEPGVKKCTERAHNGADAKFDYTVTYTDNREPMEETFYSHYVPWQEVCLLGVTEEELLAEQENASTTPEAEE